jgi:hypothetical protein
MGDYCTKDQVVSQIFEHDAAEEGRMEILIPAASRLIDRLCDVDDDFFAAAGAAVSNRTFYGSGTRFLYVGAHNSAIVAADVEFVDTTLTVPDFTERGNFLVAEKGFCWLWEESLTISAKWGFTAIPPEIEQACIELVIAEFRTGDGARERAVADAGDQQQSLAKIPARVRSTCELWKRKRPAVFA